MWPRKRSTPPLLVIAAAQTRGGDGQVPSGSTQIAAVSLQCTTMTGTEALTDGRSGGPQVDQGILPMANDRSRSREGGGILVERNGLTTVIGLGSTCGGPSHLRALRRHQPTRESRLRRDRGSALMDIIEPPGWPTRPTGRRAHHRQEDHLGARWDGTGRRGHRTAPAVEISHGLESIYQGRSVMCATPSHSRHPRSSISG
jgi:hypothetical protein